ncbi:MAG: HAMP domain-containing protein, partial [bacterium]|nr:HAMP domain-containing protein [bacterium]
MKQNNDQIENERQKAPTEYHGRLLMKMAIFMAFIALTPLIISALSIHTLNDVYQRSIEALQSKVLTKVETGIDERMLAILAPLKPQYQQPVSRLATIDGDTIVYDVIPEQSMRTLLSRIVQLAPEIEILRLVDMPSGKIVAVHAPATPVLEEIEIGRTVSGLEYFDRVANGSEVIGALRPTLAGPHIIVAMPLKTATGEVPGMLLATVRLREALSDILTENDIDRDVENSIEQSGYLYITDNAGRMLLHSRVNAVAPVSVRDVDLVGSLLLRRDIATESQKRYISYWNEEVVGSGRMKITPPMGIFMELPAEEADYIVGRLSTRFIFVTLLVIVLAALLSTYLATLIVKPIKELEKGARRIAKGDLAVSVEVKTGDEIEALGYSFNQMVEGLKELQQLRDEFVFVAAHELRTPVTAIGG